MGFSSFHIYFCFIHRMTSACDFIASSLSSYLAFGYCWYLQIYLPNFYPLNHTLLIGLLNIGIGKGRKLLLFIKSILRKIIVLQHHLIHTKPYFIILPFIQSIMWENVFRKAIILIKFFVLFKFGFAFFFLFFLLNQPIHVSTWNHTLFPSKKEKRKRRFDISYLQ